MQKLGMTREGVWRAYFLRKEGGYSDIVMYSLLREDARA